MRFAVAVVGLGLFMAGTGASVAADDRMFLLSADLTAEGRQVALPTAANPAYYVPVFLGYRERGDVVKHYERKPPDENIQRSLVTMLAKQGYLPASREFPPTLTITLEWGSIAPVVLQNRILNAAEIRTVVLGDARRDVANLEAGYAREMRSLTPRHYLIISAFQYQRQAVKEDVLLWRTHSTTDAWGNYLEEVIQPLIALAEPALGRSSKPVVAWKEPAGRVIIGPLEVRDHPEEIPKR